MVPLCHDLAEVGAREAVDAGDGVREAPAPKAAGQVVDDPGGKVDTALVMERHDGDVML